MIYEFSENNSGGSWWLSREQYDALKDAGWYLDEEKAELYDANKFTSLSTKDVPWSWRHAFRYEANSLQDAVESWESATGADFFAEGCNCCGSPFSISSVGGDWEHVSGDSVSRETIRPW